MLPRASPGRCPVFIDRNRAPRPTSVSLRQGAGTCREHPGQGHAPGTDDVPGSNHNPLPYPVAVLSADAVVDRDLPRWATSVESLLSRWAALIHAPAGSIARPVNVVSQDAERLGSGLRGLRSQVGRFVVIRPNRMHHTDAEGTDSLVVTDHAPAAVAVTAALLDAMHRRCLTPRRTRVVIAGATRMPMLCPLLTAAGISEVTSWDRVDAGRFALDRITRDAEVLIDLLSCGREVAAAARTHPDLIIVTPDTTSWALLALPELLRAVAAAPDPRVDVEVFHACALTLAVVIPHPPDPELHTRQGDAP